MAVAVAVRGYGPRCLAVGPAGPVDRAAAERLAELLRDSHALSPQDLLLSSCRPRAVAPYLARVIGQARIQHLIDGGRVDLHDVPPGLSTELGLAQ